MLEKPRLEDEKMIACLRDSYGLTVAQLEFLPIGHDSYAGVYRVEANGQTYFLKVKSDSVDEMSVSLPRYLKEQGIEQVIAPLPTITHELWGRADDFSLILYPFIEGKTGMAIGLSDSQWIEFGIVLKQIHATRLSAELLNRIARETYLPHPHWYTAAKQIQASVVGRGYEDATEKQLAAFWAGKRQEIGAIIEHTEQLGRKVKEKSLDFVVCHSDIHTNNLLIDTRGRLFVVDWDQPMLAPRERDLMFVTVGGYVPSAREETLFFQGYGKTEMDELALTFYRFVRVVEDIGAFGEQVFLTESGPETKQNAAMWLVRMFAPGGMVETAYRADREGQR